MSSPFPVELFFVNNDDVRNRMLYGVDIRFHNTRMRQKERGMLCWGLLLSRFMLKVQTTWQVKK